MLLGRRRRTDIYPDADTFFTARTGRRLWSSRRISEELIAAPALARPAGATSRTSCARCWSGRRRSRPPSGDGPRLFGDRYALVRLEDLRADPHGELERIYGLDRATAARRGRRVGRGERAAATATIHLGDDPRWARAAAAARDGAGAERAGYAEILDARAGARRAARPDAARAAVAARRLHGAGAAARLRALIARLRSPGVPLGSDGEGARADPPQGGHPRPPGQGGRAGAAGARLRGRLPRPRRPHGRARGRGRRRPRRASASSCSRTRWSRTTRSWRRMRFGVAAVPRLLRRARRRRSPASGSATPSWSGTSDSELAGIDAVVIPGGFSYGDYLRAGAIARFAPAMEAVARVRRRRRAGARASATASRCSARPGCCRARCCPTRACASSAARSSSRSSTPRPSATGDCEAGERLSIPVKHMSGRWFAPAGAARRARGQRPDRLPLRARAEPERLGRRRRRGLQRARQRRRA